LVTSTHNCERSCGTPAIRCIGDKGEFIQQP
jgi:hypothetical protein